ncbi:MAG TPA: thiol peroxidase [Anaerolineales bacterium]|nr:thiol peroxidase [Anaerolineales bacterium]
MVKERFGVIQLGGNDATVLGEDVHVGAQAPEFQAQTQDWNVINVLEETQGKVRVIASLPSISTGVCDRETRRFNEEAASLSEEIVVIPISADLPYTQANWCSAAGIDRVMMVSDHLEMSFGLQYGCVIKERRILRRAVFVVDKNQKIVYADYMAALGDEPDYGAVLSAAKKALESS